MHTCIHVTHIFITAVVCFDAKINFDDNAAFRQKDIFALRDTAEEVTNQIGALVCLSVVQMCVCPCTGPSRGCRIKLQSQLHWNGRQHWLPGYVCVCVCVCVLHEYLCNHSIILSFHSHAPYELFYIPSLLPYFPPSLLPSFLPSLLPSFLSERRWSCHGDHGHYSAARR